MTPTWEGYATKLVNGEDLLTSLKEIIEKEAINMDHEANVFVGKDTRYVILNYILLMFHRYTHSNAGESTGK